MEVAVYNIKGTATANTVALDDSIFGIEPNDHAIYLDVKQYMANQRQGTHDTLEKSTIQAVPASFTNRKVPVVHARAVSRARFSEVAPGFSDLIPAITVSNSTKN